MGNWYLLHISGHRHQIINNTGEDAFNVEMSLKGAVVAGLGGDDNWREEFDHIPYGQGPSRLIRQAWGPDGYVVIEWDAPDGERHIIDVPVR